MVLVSIILIIIGLYLLILDYFSYGKTICLKKEKIEKIAIIIPARDESSVIRGLLDSILKQSVKVDSSDVYIVVHDLSDKTVEIVKKYKMNIIERHLPKKERKGYALDDAVKEILKKDIKYDAYLIFDADNILDKDFIKNIKKPLENYDIVTAYRNCKNGNSSVVAASSALTFSMINTLGNKRHEETNKTVTLSGTGFAIRGSIISELKGYPFHSLTEDYELTLYASYHDLSTKYETNAIFYDEQPTKYKQTVKQRTRWIKGYFDTRSNYYKRLSLKYKKTKDKKLRSILLGVKPYILFLVAYLLLLSKEVIILLYNLINNLNISIPLLNIFLLLGSLYLIILFITLIMLIKEEKTLNLSLKMKIKVLLFNPVYLITYLDPFIRSILSKEVVWDKIEHSEGLIKR